MKIHLLTGFLGSGKTTAIRNASAFLTSRGKRVGVIVNDQGIRLVDGDFLKALNIPSRQVTNGCFCCNYNDLDANIQSLIETNNPDIIFAESVGSCTDIVATVLKPLLKFRPDTEVTISTFTDIRLLKMIVSGNQTTFDETVTYIYHKQLEEAGILVINKIDLISNSELIRVKQLVEEKYKNKILLYQNSQNEDSIAQWLNTLNQDTTAKSLDSLIIDYDIYAEGEAKLAWFDQDLEILSGDNNAIGHAEILVNTIFKKIREQRYSIGHLKFFINDKIKVSFTSNSPSVVQLKTSPAASVPVFINIRVQTDPETIARLVEDAIAETETVSGCKIIVSAVSAFRPGYPKPTYRM